jgi:hypothetical protein
MQTQIYRTEKRVPENGVLILDALPFRSHDIVEIIVRLREDKKEQKNRYPMRGRIVRYDEPTEPVAQNEWDALK